MDQAQSADSQRRFRYELIVVLVAAAVFFGCIFSPPSLMDDVDAVQAQIARNMLDSGDWVTARLDGVAYLEKSPLKYWMHGRFVHHLRRARLGGADSARILHGAAVLADGANRLPGHSRGGRAFTRAWCWPPASACFCSPAF